MHLGLQKIPPDAMLPGASSAAPLVRAGHHILQGGSTSVPSATGSAEKLRVGIIGCGAGMFHLDGYSEEPRAEVVALAGLDTERCQKLAVQYAIPSIYREYQELLARDDIDVVSIAVPNNLHLPMALAAFESGKHVLVEKPIARTAAEGGLNRSARTRHQPWAGKSNGKDAVAGDRDSFKQIPIGTAKVARVTEI